MRHAWQEKETAPSHADDWLITYADMITLLLCFFVLFLIISVPKKDASHKEPLRQMVEKTEAMQLQKPAQENQPTVQLPEVFHNNKPFHKIEALDDKPVTPTVEDSPVKAELAPPAIVPPAQSEPTAPPTTTAQADTPPALLPQPVDNMKMQGNANFEQKGDRITTVEINSAAFFDKGSATISAAGKTLLLSVGGNLKSDQYKNYQITIEGHTDDTPINTVQFPSNWELSTARASAVVHFLLDQGIAATKLRAAGYADTFPKVPNRDANGTPIPANEAQNRRVVIKLEKIDKAI